jgi:hypothetical protein
MTQADVVALVIERLAIDGLYIGNVGLCLQIVRFAQFIFVVVPRLPPPPFQYGRCGGR